MRNSGWKITTRAITPWDDQTVHKPVSQVGNQVVMMDDADNDDNALDERERPCMTDKQECLVAQYRHE